MSKGTRQDAWTTADDRQGQGIGQHADDRQDVQHEGHAILYQAGRRAGKTYAMRMMQAPPPPVIDTRIRKGDNPPPTDPQDVRGTHAVCSTAVGNFCPSGV